VVFLKENGCTEARQIDLEEIWTYDTTLMTQDHYVSMFRITAPSQVADPPEENMKAAPAISEHENMPVTNEH
jgi:hypothetical protein